MTKRIALFTNTLSGGGLERAMVSVANQLCENGYQVDLLLAACKGCLFDELDQRINIVCLDRKRNNIVFGSSVCRLSYKVLLFLYGIFHKLPKSIRAIPSIKEYVVKNKPDILLSSPTMASIASVIACADLDISPVLISREATTLSRVEKYKNNCLYKKTLENILEFYEHIEYVVCVSQGVKEDMHQSYNIAVEKCVVLHNPINKEMLIKKAEEKLDSNVYDDPHPYLLAMGRLEKEKDFPTLLRAYKKAMSDTGVNLLILGEGSYRNELEILVTSLGLDGKVFMPGYVKNPYPYLKSCETLVISSVREGMPNVLLEAMCFDKKVVSTNCSSSIGDKMKDYKNGEVVSVGDVTELAAALLRAENKAFFPSNIIMPSKDYLEFIESVI